MNISHITETKRSVKILRPINLLLIIEKYYITSLSIDLNLTMKDMCHNHSVHNMQTEAQVILSGLIDRLQRKYRMKTSKNL